MIYMKMLLKILLVALLSLWKIEAAVHTPSAYSLRGVQSINGSDQYGGCPEASVRTADAGSFLTEIYCSSSTGVISDTVAMVGDFSRENWARDLLTIHREARDSARLAVMFNNEVTLRAVQLKFFCCPTWNIIATNIIVYSYHNSASLKYLVNSDIQRQCEESRCGLQDHEITIPEENVFTNDQFYVEFIYGDSADWIHIAELTFSDSGEGEFSVLNITTESINDRDITPQSATYPARTESISRPSFTHSPTSGTATKHDPHSTTVTDAATTKHYSPLTTEEATTTTKHYTPPTMLTSEGKSENTTQPSQSLSQDDSNYSTIIVASAVGSTSFALLLIAMVLVLACVLYRQVRKSRQTCSNGENTPHSLRYGYSDDKQWSTWPQQTTSNVNITAEQNMAYMCNNSERESAHIYQDITESLDPPGKKGDMKMVDNAAYSTVVNTQVICTDNLAYM